jgi:hypothetical protein
MKKLKFDFIYFLYSIFDVGAGIFGRELNGAGKY